VHQTLGANLTGPQVIRDTLARHRDHPAISLPFSLPINWMLDADLGDALSKDLSVEGGSWETRRATLDLKVPAECGLYMFVYRSHLKLNLAHGGGHQATWVLYVGRAGSPDSEKTLRDRYKGEYCKYIGGNPENLWSSEPANNRARLLQRYLSIWPLEYWYLTVQDRNKIPDLEGRLIKLFSPPLNRNGHLRLRKGEPQPAFRSR
jgi:hypothetical protein